MFFIVFNHANACASMHSLVKIQNNKDHPFELKKSIPGEQGMNTRAQTSGTVIIPDISHSKLPQSSYIGDEIKSWNSFPIKIKNYSS